ncbi:MAG TPA: YbhB/YbcL family Raf kinase inhibitor-like protein [Puia sp.]|nr:YbhB/YbcL family Raf kinase inhibitor-like protein [Puia sp.]
MPASQQTLVVSSPEFVEDGLIPAKYTCQGEGINPPLDIDNVPEGTRSMVVIAEDPDAPSGTITHWVLYDILAGNSIDENTDDGVKGINSKGRMGYLPICPPSGIHRYFFHIFALDSSINLRPGADRPAVEKAMADHILGAGTLMGRYGKPEEIQEAIDK